MTDGHGRQHVALEMNGGVCHAATETGWAKSSLFARQRYDLGKAAAPTHKVQAALFQDAAAQILLELTQDEARQAAGFFELFAASPATWRITCVDV